MGAGENQNILVRLPNWLGDVVMSTPGLRALRAGFPDARIHFHVRRELAPLLDGAPWFDELHSFDRQPRWSEAWREGRALGSLRRFDLGVCLPDSFSSAFLMRAAGVECVVGYGRSGRGALLHRRISPPEGRGRQWVARERSILELVKSLGCSERGTHLELFTTDAEEARATAVLDAAGSAQESGRPWVFLAPGASFGPSKCWPVASFAAVGDQLAVAGARVGVLGTASEVALAARVCAAMSSPASNLAGVLDLGALKAALRRAAAVVCNDAGARHVAVAFGVPCVVLMGPTRLEKTGMNLDRVAVLQADVPCRPCYQRQCPIDHRCMTRLSPEAVLDALRDGRGTLEFQPLESR